jgi:hypothetical protein
MSNIVYDIGYNVGYYILPDMHSVDIGFNMGPDITLVIHEHVIAYSYG